MGYFDRKEYNIKIFKETMDFIKHADTQLQADITNSIENQQVIPEDVHIMNAMPSVGKPGFLELQHTDTMSAALEYCMKWKTAILNFASWTTPGGMVWQGSNAQEESICRQTYLYTCLSDSKMKKQFYNRHKVNYNPLANNDIIYTPAVDILRFGDIPDNDQSLSEPYAFMQPPYPKIDVITCAAPNLRHFEPIKVGVNVSANAMGWIDNSRSHNNKILRKDIYNLHYSRARSIITAATAMGVDVIILGAFGCGVFMNPPEVVAGAWKKALEDTNKPFLKIVFAIPDQNSVNYKTFAKNYM